ncbi:MAG: hypothetical protein EP329_19050 [Deltaproteobacteria bacterium]|nr:MAG: hypothetical protein EP329_19050 [Deltaproteobacteria bacterium]
MKNAIAFVATLSFVLLAGSSAFAKPGNGNTVPICHYDGQGRVHLIYVNEHAVPAHVANHGDHGLIAFFADADGDGFGDAGAVVEACAQPEGYVTDDTDCNDGDASVFPGAEEVCWDGIDNNCDGQIDEGCGFDCGEKSASAVKMLNYQPQVYDGSYARCVEVAHVTVEICRQWPDQQMVISQDAAGTVTGKWDELGVFEVTSPSGNVDGVNFVFWQNLCADTRYPQYYLPASTDITDLFGDEVGYFTVDLRVNNGYQPYSWWETWVVRK